MPRFDNVRDRVHQPRYDSLVRGLGISNINNSTPLFTSADVSDRGKTNMTTPGVLSSDATFVMKAIRSVLYFQSLNDSQFNAAFGQIPAITNSTATNARALDLYQQMAYGSTFTLKMGGTKDFLQAPLWYIPAGGGISGFTTENSRSAVTNGVASHEAILRLARDIPFNARQTFQVIIDFFPFNPISGNGQGGAMTVSLSPQLDLNQFDGLKLVQIMIDGVETRDAL